MNDTEWREKVYNPYLEAWKIMRLIQHGKHFGTDEVWEKFTREAERLCRSYPQNRYIESLCEMLLEAGCYIAAENSKEDTKERTKTWKE